MAGGYDVSVKLNLVDNTSNKLKSIEKNMDRVVKTAQAYNTVIEKLTRSFNALNKSASTTMKTLDTVSTNLGKIGLNQDTIKDSATYMGSLKEATEEYKETVKKLRTQLGDVNTLQQAYNSNVKAGVTKQKSFNTETAKLKNGTRYINQMADAQGKLNYKIGQGTSMMTSFKGTLKQVAGMYLGMESLKTALNWSDELTLTEGKLAQLTDDVEGFMDKAYQMSQETRTSYMDNASQMAKMWQLTGGTDGIFETEDKLIQFNELLNKGFVLGGSGTREINASMYQLTQALSSGRLQGDELRSLAENAPYLINTITNSIEEMYNAGKSQDEWIDLTYNDLKELGAQGVLTSDLITNAVLNSADEIREAYKNITPTWEQTFTTLKNQVQKISQPILQTINEIINSESFEKFTQTLVKIFSVIMAMLNPILQGLMWVGEIMADNWNVIEPIIWGIVGALGAYLTYLTLAKVYTVALGVVQGFQLLMSKGVGLSMVENNVALGIYNGLAPVATVMSNMLGAAKMFLAGATWSAVVAEYGLLAPILLIIAIIGALIAAVYLVVYAYNKWTGSTISATGIIVGAFYWLWEAIKNIFKWIWNLLVEVAEFIANVFNDPVYYAKQLFGGFGKAVINVFKWVASGIENLVNFFIDGINAMIDAYNSVPFADNVDKVGKVDFTSGFDDAIAGIDKWIGKKETKTIDYSDKKFKYGDLDEAYEKGYAKGESWGQSIKDMFNTDKFLGENDFNLEDYTNEIPGIEDWVESQPKYDTPNTATSSSLPDDVNNAIKGIKGDTDELTSMGEEDLKYLRDIAEQKVINRFTTAEIKVTSNITNNVSGDRDLAGMEDYFTELLEKACETTAERTNG